MDGMPVDAALKRLESLRGGVEGWRKLNASYFATIQDDLFGSGIAKDRGRSLWTLRFSDGRTATRAITAYLPSKNEPSFSTVRWYSTEPVAGFTAGWKSLPTTANNLPLPLRDYANNFRRIWLPRSCVVFIQLKAIENADGQNFGSFLSETEADLEAHPPCGIILDLRYSIGGDFTQIAGFGSRLPSLLGRGRVYILTSAMTFSASIGAAAFVKQAGERRVAILGEPIGDRLVFFSEGNSGCTPNSDLCLYYATGKNDFSAPCFDPDICYWADWFFPLRVKSLQPDETIATSFVDWLRGRDPVFDRAVVLANERA
jgi:hypothetical protein